DEPAELHVMNDPHPLHAAADRQEAAGPEVEERALRVEQAVGTERHPHALRAGVDRFTVELEAHRARILPRTPESSTAAATSDPSVETRRERATSESMRRRPSAWRASRRRRPS